MSRTPRLMIVVAAWLLAITLVAPEAASAQGPDDKPDSQHTRELLWLQDLPVLPDGFDADQVQWWLNRFPQLPRNQTDAFARGQRAIERLGNRLPEVARAYGLHKAELEEMLATDVTLFVDDADELVYFDVLAPDHHEYAVPTSPAAEAAAALFEGFEFGLSSNPGASKTIFLDFDGHATQGTSWNAQHQIETINSPAFDTDGDPTSWSAAELDVIVRSWAVVAEDYAPWNVNVTTVDPGSEALRYSGFGDNEWGVRVLITTDTAFDCACGGIAYIGSFDDYTDEPAFVFNTSFAGISEAITHEVGHTLLLAHDGSSTQGYYRGHRSADTPSWGPIMGAAYFMETTQWSQQEFSGADNNGINANFGYGRDDIAILSSLTNGNNFGLRADDHGQTASSATVLETGSTDLTGLIGSRDDRDTFAFSTSGGVVDFVAGPAAIGPNLDISLTLRDGAGTVVATSNPAATLDASLSTPLPAGDYTIEIDGVGAGNPSSATPSGYSDYGSIGTYSFSARIPAHSEDAPVALMGDVNCDSQASVSDALLIAQYSVGNRTSSTCPLDDPSTQIYAAAADVNNDGRVNVADALVISQCSVGLPNEFCPPG